MARHYLRTSIIIIISIALCQGKCSKDDDCDNHEFCCKSYNWCCRHGYVCSKDKTCFAIAWIAIPLTVVIIAAGAVVCFICLRMLLYVRSTAMVIYGREKLRKKEKPETRYTYSTIQ